MLWNHGPRLKGSGIDEKRRLSLQRTGRDPTPAVPGIVVLHVRLTPDPHKPALFVEVPVEPHPRSRQRFNLLCERRSDDGTTADTADTARGLLHASRRELWQAQPRG